MINRLEIWGYNDKRVYVNKKYIWNGKYMKIRTMKILIDI